MNDAEDTGLDQDGFSVLIQGWPCMRVGLIVDVRGERSPYEVAVEKLLRRPPYAEEYGIVQEAGVNWKAVFSLDYF